MSDFHILSKLDLAAMRACDHLVVRIDQKNAGAVGQVLCVKKLKRTVSNPFQDEARYTVGDGSFAVFASRWNVDVSRAHAFTMIWQYPGSQVTHQSSILQCLRAGDEVRFEFIADHGSSPMLLERGLHCDVLQLVVRRGGKVALEFELEQHIAPAGSTRMVRDAVRRHSEAV